MGKAKVDAYKYTDEAELYSGIGLVTTNYTQVALRGGGTSNNALESMTFPEKLTATELALLTTL